MNFDFKNIHIGSLIQQKIAENGIEISRICNFIKYTEKDLKKIYEARSLDTELLLRLSKVLQYDFFRLYTQHLILFSPPSPPEAAKKSLMPHFRKNIYTREVINFIIEQIQTGQMTKSEVMERYKIPKTTLYKWLIKYDTSNHDN